MIPFKTDHIMEVAGKYIYIIITSTNILYKCILYTVILYRYNILIFFFSNKKQCFIFRKIQFLNINLKNAIFYRHFSIDIRLQHNLSTHLQRFGSTWFKSLPSNQKIRT